MGNMRAEVLDRKPAGIIPSALPDHPRRASHVQETR
jgi:hypothetical protein